MNSGESYLIDLEPFFADPRRFLEELHTEDFRPKGYDCSAQVAIRLVRLSQSIQLTPRQNHVMNQIVSEAIQRAAAIIIAKIRGAAWSIPDHRDDHHDLALSAASKAFQLLVERHDMTVVPHPNLAVYVETHTRFSSRDALEDFIYKKRLDADAGRPLDTTFSKAALERRIRQRRSELGNLSGEMRRQKRADLERMEAILFGARTEVRLEYALQERGDEDQHLGERLSSDDILSLSIEDIEHTDETEDYTMPDEQRDFLNLLIQVGQRQVSVRNLIPYLVGSGEYRAVLGLLEVLKGSAAANPEAAALQEILNTALSSVRKQALRPRKTDRGEVATLFGACKGYLRGEQGEHEVLAALQAVSA
ncbi:hypothetical protein [Acidithiobacillus sp.]|uniref:hypothetical protein n=1 Tax=Acidithiobacillus sp. TaxID=1872118 RepID=UPI003D067291